MKTILLIILLFYSTLAYNQTVVEMMSPEDATIILLEVDNKSDADIYVYKTKKKSEYKEWFLMWRFRKGGWSNFAIYVVKDTTKLFVPAAESIHEKDTTYQIQGKVFFVDDKKDIGYKTAEFRLPGLMRRIRLK